MTSEYRHKKFTRVLIALAIISIFLGSAFISASSYPKPDNINNQTLPKPQRISEKTETSVILLDSPGKTLVWNESATISAKLVVEDSKEPIAYQVLLFTIYLNQSWTFFGAKLANDSGIAEFTFFVDMKNGDYKYKVSFIGTSVYSSAEKESFFTVIRDDDIWAVINEVVCSDELIRVTYTVYTNLDPNWYIGGIDWIDFSIDPGWRNEITGDTSFGGYMYRRVIFPDPAITTQQTFVETVTCQEDPWIPWEMHITHASLIKVYISLHMTFRHIWWLWDQRWGGTSQVYDFKDDDNSPPMPAPVPPRYSSVSVTDYDMPYNLVVNYSDASGWEGWVQYQFFDERNQGDVSQVYGPYKVGETTETGYKGFLWQIPYSVWSLYPECTIRYKTMAIDLDKDGGFTEDQSVSPYQDYWFEAGKIFQNIGSRIDSVSAYAYLQGADGTWSWQLVTISRDYVDPFQDLYVDDENYVRVTIVNPSDQAIAIENGMLRFSCDDFKTDIVIPTEDIDPIPAFDIRELDLQVRFLPSDFKTLGGEHRVDVLFSFSYYYASEPSNQIDSSYPTWWLVARPPAPESSFIGYVGPQEWGSFIYKYGGSDSEISAEFQVMNHARIRMKVTLDSEITPESISSEADILSCLIEKLRIEEHKEFTVNPGINEISFLIHSESTFFLDEDLVCEFLARSWLGLIIEPAKIKNFEALSKFFDAMDVAGKIVKDVLGRWGKDGSVAAAKKLVEDNIVSISDWAMVSTAVKVVSFLLDSAILSVALLSQDSERNYAFVSKITWVYLLGSDGKRVTLFSDLGYSGSEIGTGNLHLTPSNLQLLDHTVADIFKITAIGLSLVPVESGVGALLATAASWILGKLADDYWKKANDDAPFDQDYTEIYQPTYPAYSLTGYEPQNEFEESLLQLVNASAQYMGDLVASNITSSRMEAALNAGDYEATVDQASALMECTDRMIADSKAMKNAVELLSCQLLENSSYYIDGSITLESHVSQNGLSGQDKLALEALGLNETEIGNLNQAIMSLAKENAFSQAVSDIFPLLNESADNSTKLFGAQIADLENLAKDLINKTIDIKTTFLGESVTAASSVRIIELDQLLSDISALYNNGEWREVGKKADVLIEIASATALETNNCTYLGYVDSARVYKANAEQYLKLNLYHLKEIEVTETDTKLMTVIAHSDGAPTADYLLETNCSWVTPIQQIVSMTQYQRTTVELEISTQNTAPGVYHVNLRLYLPQTNTIVDSLLTVRVVDDDVTPPSITISYSGSQTDGDPGSWNVCVTDGESGLDDVRILVDGTEILYDQTLTGLESKSCSIPVPATLGTHDIQVTARNNDKEWIGDQESSTAVGSVLIEDDDTTPPTPVIEAVDCVSDGQPGCWRVTAEDASGLSQIVINIDGVEVVYTQEVFGAGTHVELLIPISNELGAHVCSGYAIDADNDRGAMDQLAVSLQPVCCTIVDDDTSPPQLSNLVISDSIHSVDISLTAVDQSTIGGFVILVNGEIVQPTAMVQDGDNYRFSLANQWILKNGIYSVEIVVTDSDNDRPNDALSSSILGTFETSLSEMYGYVGWQIEDLRQYIEGSLDTELVPSIDHKLSLAYSHLQKALGFIESGRITCGLVHDKAAHVLIKTVEFEIGILCRLGRIGDEGAQHIMDSLRVIRDSIVILMGASTGTERGYDLACSENDLVNLAGLIADEISCRDGWHLNSLISSAAQRIEEAIFRIPLNCDIEGTLSSAQWQLEKAKCEVNQLLNQGKISADLANSILSAIGQAYSNIELIKNLV